MFGSSGGSDSKDTPAGDASATGSDGAMEAKPAADAAKNVDDGTLGDKRGEKDGRPLSTGNDGVVEKKRRSSGVTGKASSFLASAKDSLSFSKSGSKSNATPESPTQTPMQKLGKQDPALNVPQGQQNNSAGESHPGPRSTFKVGVWEDRNKKCRRTMEDTHAFLYNFLHTPAPSMPDAKNQAEKPSEDPAAPEALESSASSPASMMETDNGYFAIFDGHAGTFAADWCGKKLHIILEETIRKNPNTPIPELLDETFTTVDAQLEKLPVKNSGCTAVAAVLRWEDRIPNSQSATGSTAIAPATVAAVKAAEESYKGDEAAVDSGIDMSKSPDHQNIAPTTAAAPALGETHAKLKSTATRHRVLYTANVGDARIILCRNGKALRLSYDHKGSDENEGRRITNAGGLILHNRVNGVLAVTRALGDSYMKELVTGHPYTTETVIQPDLDEFIILACDGLWDVCSDQEACDLVRNDQDPTEAAKKLVEYALARFSTDNLSCMIVRFNRPVLVATAQSSAAAIGVEGDPNSHAGKISEVDKIVGDAKRKAQGAGNRSADANATTGAHGAEVVSAAGTKSDEILASTTKQSSMERVEEEESAQSTIDVPKIDSPTMDSDVPTNPTIEAVSHETIENMKLPDPIARQASKNQ